MTKIQESLIVNLKRARARRGLSQMKLADFAGLSLGFVGDIESGKKVPSLRSLEKMIQVLQIEPYELFIDPVNPAQPFPRRRMYKIRQDLLKSMEETIHFVFEQNNI